MPKIIRVTLTEEQRAALNARARARERAPRLRERLEMVRLSDRGQTVPPIARALDAHEQTVRTDLKAFLADGFGALRDAAAQGGRSWTTPHVRHWLATERGVRVSTGRLGVLLRRARFRWKRTTRAVRPRRTDPSLQDAADAHLASLSL